MWDSLKSIYLKAREDKCSDFYVILIPYYDKNANGSFEQMHYEGYEFPRNISITSWQDYSIEENQHVTEKIWRHILTLLSSTSLTDEQLESVVLAVKEIL